MKCYPFLLSFLLIALSRYTGCSKDCEPVNTTCTERPPKDELCQAYFTRWFYNEDTNQCEEIGYSGCSQQGFETQKVCEECLCR